MSLKDLSPDSKLWLYQSSRALTATETDWINTQLEAFSADWAAHGNQLKAAGEVLNPYFVALAVDLTQANTTGCSIDSSVRFIKSIGKELNVDFFNRLKMLVENEAGEQTLVAYKQITENPEAFVYNPLLNRLGDLADKFRIKATEFQQSITH